MQTLKFHTSSHEYLTIDWFKRREKIVVQFCSIIIISEISIQMTIHKLDKVHEMNICLTNVCKKCHLSLVRGNKQMSFSKSLKILDK